MRTHFLQGLLAVLLCFIASTVCAQDIPPVASVLFKDGNIVVFRDTGQQEIATNDVALPESITVMTNGTFKVGSGKVRKLAEGDSLGADGNLTSRDGAVMPVIDHIVMKRGRLMVVKDGESTPASSEVKLGDGTRVKPDGTITPPSGRVYRMLDGQISRFSGAPFPATDTLTVKDGVVVLQKDGGRITLKRSQTMMMSDGTKVFGDGTVKRPDGTKIKVTEGEIYKVPGVLPAQK